MVKTYRHSITNSLLNHFLIFKKLTYEKNNIIYIIRPALYY